MRKTLPFLLCALLCAAALPALASPTGATPAEIHVYTAPGTAAEGLPAHAENTLGEKEAIRFMAERRAAAQTGFSEAEMVIAGVDWAIIEAFLKSIPGGLPGGYWSREAAEFFYKEAAKTFPDFASSSYSSDTYFLAPDGTLYLVDAGTSIPGAKAEGEHHFNSIEEAYWAGFDGISIVDPKVPTP